MSFASRLGVRRMPLQSAGWARRRSLIGIVYAMPTLVFVVVFFIAPLLLVGQMSASDWKLLSGDRGINLPRNYNSVGSNILFWRRSSSPSGTRSS